VGGDRRQAVVWTLATLAIAGYTGLIHKIG
jgi:hypothetical protein